MEPTAISPPYFNKEELKQMEMSPSVDCITKGDMPSAIQGRYVFHRMCRFSRRSFNWVLGPDRNRSTQRADSAWEMMVASAAPCTPKPSPKMRMGSRMMLVMAPMRVLIMLVVAKPWVEIKGFNPSATCTNRVPQA